MTPLNLFQPSDTFHTETNHLICCANQMAGFYMKCKTGIKWVEEASKLCNWGNRWGDWIQSFNWSHYNASKTVMKAPSAFFSTRAWDVEVTLDKRCIYIFSNKGCLNIQVYSPFVWDVSSATFHALLALLLIWLPSLILFALSC